MSAENPSAQRPSSPPQPPRQNHNRNTNGHGRGHANANGNGKRPLSLGEKRGMKKQRSKRERSMKEGTSEEVLRLDVQALIKSRREAVKDYSAGEEDQDQTQTQTESQLPEPGTQIDIDVLELSSTGDGLGVEKGSVSAQVYVVPFVVPGDVARVKVFRHEREEGHSVADFLSIVSPSPLRDDARIACQYFGKCSGCQFQMLDYAEQLRHKRSIVVKAFRNFSQLPPELVPTVGETIGSPLQLGYRTKLTPHFDGPPGNPRKKSQRGYLQAMPPVGFNEKGRRSVLDIEDCPIGTDAVRLGMKRERERMRQEFGNYRSGATILLRESTKRYPKDGGEQEQEQQQPQPPTEAETPGDAVRVDAEKHVDIKTCVTDNKAMSSEYVDDFLFTSPAGSFFQNNNSILSPFTAYVRDHVLPPASSSGTSSSQAQAAAGVTAGVAAGAEAGAGAVATTTSTTTSEPATTSPSSQPPPSKRIKYLIDAYSGSGLFTITLSGLFESSTGIDIAADSIACARENARANGIPESQCSFMAADAPQLFKHVRYDRDETVVVIDPPRKGCDASFLGQLLRFGPRRVLYVSCNVHTQARDVGVLVRGEVEGWQPEEGSQDKERSKTRYEIESVRGFDFFPQTGHVEGVAVLNRVDE